jgi:hypothetical protein
MSSGLGSLLERAGGFVSGAMNTVAETVSDVPLVGGEEKESTGGTGNTETKTTYGAGSGIGRRNESHCRINVGGQLGRSEFFFVVDL